MDFYDSLDSDERLAREAARSAVVLTKIRYDEQLAPFVRDNRMRLASRLVQTELARIVKECSDEVGADPAVVFDHFTQVLADVVLPVTEPEHVELDEASLDSSPPARYDENKPEAQATTDVNDHGAVLEEEITNPGKVIPVQGCFRCQKNAAVMPSPLCEECEAHILIEAGVQPDFLALPPKEGYGYAPPGATNFQAQPNSPQQMGQPAQPGQQSMTSPSQSVTPLNPNSPYQCNVCGRTGTWQELQQHIEQATDTAHMQAKNQQMQQGYGQSGMPQQQATAAAGDDEGDADAYYDNVHQDDVKVDAEQQQLNPKTHFQSIVQRMADRAAARQLSTPTEKMVNAVSTAYGLDPEQVKSSLFVTSQFGNYSFTNGQPGQQQAPNDYVPLDLDGKQGQDSGHEVVVPVIAAVRRVATDLGMDEHSVYSSVKDAMGADLSENYHATANGHFTMYVPRSLMDQATNHPQPPAPDDGSGGNAPPQGGPPPGGPSGAPGSPIETMQPIQPTMQPQGHYLGKKLNQEYLDWLLMRDEALAEKRMARRGYLKLR